MANSAMYVLEMTIVGINTPRRNNRSDRGLGPIMSAYGFEAASRTIRQAPRHGRDRFGTWQGGRRRARGWHGFARSSAARRAGYGRRPACHAARLLDSRESSFRQVALTATLRGLPGQQSFRRRPGQGHVGRFGGDGVFIQHLLPARVPGSLGDVARTRSARGRAHGARSPFRA